VVFWKLTRGTSRPKFNAIVSKFNFKLEGDKIAEVGGGNDGSDDPVSKQEPAAKKSKPSPKPVTPRKRILARVEEEEEEEENEE